METRETKNEMSTEAQMFRERYYAMESEITALRSKLALLSQALTDIQNSTSLDDFEEDAPSTIDWIGIVAAKALESEAAPTPAATVSAEPGFTVEVLMGLVLWFVRQFEGESGGGNGYWEQFPQYKIAQRVAADAERLKKGAK